MTSVDRLRDVVGSNDKVLAKTLKDKYRKLVEHEWGDLDDLDEDDQEEVQEGLKEFSNDVNRLIKGSSAKGLEPGAWVFVFKLIIDELNLKTSGNLPINKGYKHHYAWKPYRELIAASVAPSAVENLKHIENGRPMKGKGLQDDGSSFAWLTAEEVAELHKSLTAVGVTDSELRQFHEDLVQSLAILKDNNAALFVIAH
ncbi:MAG: hypothetical protein U0941_01225 [Planctomycetaceae bacterium]